MDRVSHTATPTRPASYLDSTPPRPRRSPLPAERPAATPAGYRTLACPGPGIARIASPGGAVTIWACKRTRQPGATSAKRGAVLALAYRLTSTTIPPRLRLCLACVEGEER